MHALYRNSSVGTFAKEQHPASGMPTWLSSTPLWRMKWQPDTHTWNRIWRRWNVSSKMQLCFISGNYHSSDPASVRNLLPKNALPQPQQQWDQIRLTLHHKMVDRLVLVMPSENPQAQEARETYVHQTQKDSNYNIASLFNNFIQNNNRCFTAPTCQTDQY